MAETTMNYGLKCPAETDYYNVEDHNENMRKIDDAIGSRISTGVYTGNGEDEIFIPLPRKPKFVLVLRRGASLHYNSYIVGGLALENHPAHEGIDYLIIEEGGFRVRHDDSKAITTNRAGMEFFYLWG